MRKYLIVAIAALTAMAFTAVAIAQTPAATMKVKVGPKKAGTKKAAVNAALAEYVRMLKRRRLLELRGQVPWEGSLDRMRERRSK